MKSGDTNEHPLIEFEMTIVDVEFRKLARRIPTNELTAFTDNVRKHFDEFSGKVLHEHAEMERRAREIAAAKVVKLNP